MTKQTILVTGATGNIGREVVRLLVDAHENVFAGSRTGKEQQGAAGRPVDFENVDSLTAAFRGIDTLFLLFPLVPNKIKFAQNAVEAAKRAGVKHIVRSSGAGADSQSPVALGQLQGTIDDVIAGSGIPYTLVRPATFMQNFANYFAGMIKSGTVHLSVADGKSSYVDARDIALAISTLLKEPQKHAGKAYTITGSEALSVHEALAAITEVSGNPINYVPVPEEAAVDSMRTMGMDDWTINIMSSLNRATAAGYTAGVTDDFQQLTGKSPRSFASFAKDYANAWK